MRKIFFILMCILILSGCSISEKSENNTNVSLDNKEETTDNGQETQREIFELEGLENELIGWGIKKNEGAPPDVPGNIKEMLKKYNAVYIGDENSKKIYLTFDEGYENGYTKQILDVLKKNQVPAAFFITGDYIDREPELVERMYKEGHIIGNHSENHPSFPLISENEIINEIDVLNKKITNITGEKVKFIRPPKGEYSEKVLAQISNLGYITVFWSFAYLDWDVTLQRGAEYAYRNIMPYIDGGAIILLHAVSPDNADCLDRIIKESKAMGFEFSSIDDFCNII